MPQKCDKNGTNHILVYGSTVNSLSQFESEYYLFNGGYGVAVALEIVIL